jgi:hypothetical protein
MKRHVFALMRMGAFPPPRFSDEMMKVMIGESDI